jgi:thioredoxin reductase
MMSANDVTIIGAGPAGIAAAVQLRRYGLDPLVLEAQRVGGLLWNAHRVENYLGFPSGISGHELVELFQRQLETWSVPVFFEEVRRLSFSDGLFRIETDRVRISRFVIVATGTQPVRAEIAASLRSSEIRERIFYEVYPLLGIRAKKIVIMGAGDAAFDYALNLAARDNDIAILHRSAEIKALPLLQARACMIPKIAYYGDTKLVDIKLACDELQLKCANRTQKFAIRADYLLLALGRRPRLDFLDARLPVEELSHRGRLYFAGDVQNDRYRQTAIAVGDGLRAAMQICERLDQREAL